MISLTLEIDGRSIRSRKSRRRVIAVTESLPVYTRKSSMANLSPMTKLIGSYQQTAEEIISFINSLTQQEIEELNSFLLKSAPLDLILSLRTLLLISHSALGVLLLLSVGSEQPTLILTDWSRSRSLQTKKESQT